MAKVLVCGAGGFIGGWLCRHLATQRCCHVTGVDVKALEDWWQRDPQVLAYQADVGERDVAMTLCQGKDWVVNLAADMGGMGFIEREPIKCLANVRPSSAVTLACHALGVKDLTYASSACVYPGDLAGQMREEHAYPARELPEYGWEKLFSERCALACGYTALRFHNVYGPHGSWRDGREKAPAALCRKLAEYELGLADHVEVWGDGTQVRSFMYVEDAVSAIMKSYARAGVWNAGSSRAVTINGLLSMVCDAAGLPREVPVLYVDGPLGVASRNCDGTRAQNDLGFTETWTLETGLKETYAWVRSQVRQHASLGT